jgi:hypothetical protein
MHGVKPGPSRSPPHASPRRQCPPARTLRAPRRHGAADAPASTRDRCRRSAGTMRVSPHNATRPPGRRQPRRRGSAQSQDRASPSVCAALRRRTSPPLTSTQQHVGLPLAVMSRSPRVPAPPPATSHPKAPPTSCHLPLCTNTRSGTFPASPTRSCSGGSSTPQNTGSATPTTPTPGATTPRGSAAW